ncbi:hypothetical protein L288_00755 [Sphingobium quisquiliarum P25]|uniref:Uncharacterized protein n=1 Tax=Sphingobium quisquiliarum P25 TaxID=1329909 RepID=T0IYG3_9SPHN|nr:hypothetical protein [Sphingobium quisquiliarum]EQB14714.1 hypothetical protein L288_00755 [Sphingobium quisquiliarum P25]
MFLAIQPVRSLLLSIFMLMAGTTPMAALLNPNRADESMAGGSTR